MIAVQVVMIISRVHSINLFNFSNGIYGDIEMIGWNESYSWPEIPKGYQVPGHYNYPKK